MAIGIFFYVLYNVLAINNKISNIYKILGYIKISVKIYSITTRGFKMPAYIIVHSLWLEAKGIRFVNLKFVFIAAVEVH